MTILITTQGGLSEGLVFEGNLAQWEDVFFTFRSPVTTGRAIDEVISYCEAHGYSLKITLQHN